MGEAVEQDDIDANEGWADAMQKILGSNKPKRKKTVVLAKAKKLSLMKPPALKSDETSDNKEVEINLRKADWLSKGKLKPNPLERNREKQLQKITVKGVVQLFNAVNQHQRNVVNPNASSFKIDKQLKSINKNTFLDILLHGKDASKSGEVEENGEKKKKSGHNKEEKSEEEESGTWSVLKNDFMISNKWKNWDQTKPNDIEMIPECN